jgi:hypothetical protein
VKDERGKGDLDLDRFLEMVPDLSQEELLGVSAAYANGDPESREVARERVVETARRLDLVDELQRLEGSIAQWAGSEHSRSGVYTGQFLREPMLADLRLQAMSALIDAASVLLLGDALDEEARVILLAPLWSAVIER